MPIIMISSIILMKQHKGNNSGPKQKKHKQGKKNNKTSGNNGSSKKKTRKGNTSHNNKHHKGEKGSSAASFLKQTLASIISTAAVQNTSKLGDENDKSAGGTAGNFDVYLFAQSWAPRFCCISPGKCVKEGMEGVNSLSVHGLWPAYMKPDSTDRTYPAFCSRHSSTNDRTRESHEWEKHGTCTGLPRETYFQEEKRLDSYTSRPKAFLTAYTDDAMPVDDFVSQFGGPNMVAVKTDAHCRLEEITTCWQKLPDGTVGKQTVCPDHVLASARNSAIMHNQCKLVWIDVAGSCRFVNKSFRQFLRTGVQKAPVQEAKE